MTMIEAIRDAHAVAMERDPRVVVFGEDVGHFGGGGSSGVGGCDRSFVLTEKVDVLQHYREALDDAGWRVVEEDENRLRAERHGMTFEVALCDQGGVVWAGRVRDRRGTHCGQDERAGR